MLIRLAYLLPFSYFWVTRLRNGSIGFHLLFEWLAAAVVVVALDPANAAEGLYIAVLSYLAFISLYEIGYIANDLFAARKEADGRLRGPQGTPLGWVAGWVLARLAVFALVSYVLHKAGDVMWWAFFGGLAVVFAMHNHLRDRELKAGTFLWLSWYRFMAPIMFAVSVAKSASRIRERAALTFSEMLAWLRMVESRRFCTAPSSARLPSTTSSMASVAANTS